MRNARRTLRCSTFWGMIPLALLAGLPTTSCFCADGGFKLFCGGHVAGAQTSASDSHVPSSNAQSGKVAQHCPACPAKDGAADDSAARASETQTANGDLALSDSCCSTGQPPVSGSPTECCRLVESTTGTLTSVVPLPDLNALGFANVVEIVSAPRLVAAALARSFDVFEIGPPVDRVIVHCSLLI
jgi:hypothetical protein